MGLESGVLFGQPGVSVFWQVCSGLLSRTGPMTLMQIATDSGHVYLFDVQKEPRMFKDGGLKGLLENNSVLKVLQSARNDGEALFWQHGVELRPVHDTQLAHMEVDRADGRCFPTRHKLLDIVHIYCPEKEGLLTEGKEAVQTKCNKTEGEYWAKRPLTEEMKRYATNDVIALVPEVYQAQTRELQKRGLTGAFTTRVEQDLRRRRDRKLEDELQKQQKELIAKTLKAFTETPGAKDNLADIEDINVLNAITLLPFNDIAALGLPPFVRQLKLQHIKNKLDVLEKELTEKGGDYEVSVLTCRFLHSFITVLPDDLSKHRAQKLEDKLKKIVLDDIKRKYTAATPTNYLGDEEKLILLRRMRPNGAIDPSFDPVVLELHWKLKLEDLEDNIARFQKDRTGYTASEGYVQLLKFYRSSQVGLPPNITERGTWFLRELESAGKVSSSGPNKFVFKQKQSVAKQQHA